MKKRSFHTLIVSLASTSVFCFSSPADTGDTKIEPFQVASSVAHVVPLIKNKDDFIKMGRYIVLGGDPQGFFSAKGYCPVCHSFFKNKNFRDRAPNLFGVEKRSHTRIKEDRYLNGSIKIGENDPLTGFIKGRPDKVIVPYKREGSAELTGEDYLRESLMYPNCYIVKGYEKDRAKGGSMSGDKIPLEPMPANHQPPLGLNPVELNAVIAWLQYKDDRDLSKVTVSPPAEGYPPLYDFSDESETYPTFYSDEESVEEMVNGLGCPLCHTIPGIEGAIGELGPPLNLEINGPKRLKDPRYKGSATTIREYVEESILKPSEYVVFDEETGEHYPDGLKPNDYSKKMTVGALEKLVDFISKTNLKQYSKMKRPPYYNVEDPPYYIDTTTPKNK
jgi:hypothetical protein